jgi:alpha-galactosidase
MLNTIARSGLTKQSLRPNIGGSAQMRHMLLTAGLSIMTAFSTQIAHTQVNGVGVTPYAGWSSFSEQTINGNFLTQANIQAQSDALRSSGLQDHGFTYINIDSGWMGSFDANGRPIPNTTPFPNIKALVDHIHANGQKAGIYWIPGIEQPAVDANYPILGTSYHTQDIVVTPHVPGNSFSAGQTDPFHIKIDFTKPGAQEYINSVVNLFASWGIDFIKLDGVTPGSYVDDLSIDNRPDVEAWSKAIAQNGRAIWLTVSWQLDQDYLDAWQQFSNARRIDDDVECEGNCTTLTNWPRIVLRQYDLIGWEHNSGPTLGWNDLDSLDVGDGTTDGLSNQEKQTAITIWTMANAPLYLGGDLTTLDSFGKSALSNDEVLAVDQSGHPAIQITGGSTPVWMADTGDGSDYVAIYNLNGFPTPVALQWSDLGFVNATAVRDLWTHNDLGPRPLGYSTILPGHGSRLLKVRRSSTIPSQEGQSYEAESAVLSGTATVSTCNACSGGAKAGFLGASTTSNSVTFNNVQVKNAGIYRMQVDYLTEGPRAILFSVNGGPTTTLNLGGGSFNLPASTTVPIKLEKGVNTITFNNPATFAADLDRIIISGHGVALPPPPVTTYEAEAAVLGGSASIVGCGFCSGGGKAGNLGGAGSTVAFTKVTVPYAGNYQLELDFLTSGPRSFQLEINNATPTTLNLNGSSFQSPASTVITVALQAGTNTIQFSNPTGFAPDLDSITIGPVINTSSGN